MVTLYYAKVSRPDFPSALFPTGSTLMPAASSPAWLGLCPPRQHHRGGPCHSRPAFRVGFHLVGHQAVTALVSPQAANIERASFAVLGVVINALDAAGAAAGATGLNVTPERATRRRYQGHRGGGLERSARCGGAVNTRPSSVRPIGPFKHVRLGTNAAKR
jgi:hypothetical protein